MNRRTNRRDFLKFSTAAGLGAWAAGDGAAQSPGNPATPPAGANDRIRIAVIGVGGRGRDNLNAVRNEEVVALCDVDDNILRGAAQNFPRAERFHDFRRMLDQLHRTIDAVVVSTPDHTHAPAAAAALRLGKHVYCEKPLTHSVFEARMLADLAAHHRVVTQMGTQHHASENYHRVVEVIQRGLIGPVSEVHTWTNRPIWPQGINRPTETPAVPPNLDWDLWLGPAPQRPYNSAYAPFRWRGWWDFGTGSLGDMACHIMDPVFWALWLGHPTSIEAEGEQMTAESPPRRCTIHWQFPARGDLPPVRLTWYDGGRVPARELTEGEATGGDGGSLFVGTNGRKLMARHGGNLVLLPRDRFDNVQRPEPFLRRPAGGHHGSWLRAIRDRSLTTGSNFAYAGPMTEAILLGNVALRAGQRIEWDATRLRVTNVAAANQYVRREYRTGWTL
jgi:predicted dehydrogenase